MKMHSGILSPSHLFSAALLAAALFAAPPAKADITINGTSYSGAVNLSGANYTISGTGTTSNRLIVKENCTITFDNVSFPLSTGTTNAISVFPGKTVTLKLSGENTITLSGTKQTGISVPSTSTLNITNITDDAKLIVTATGTRNLAIGGQYCAGKCGTINIWGGAISASSGTYSAGIGSYNTEGGTVNIYGGTVVAKGGTYGAGIGGASGSGGTVNIYGGTVKATGSATGAGIGGGNNGAGGTITIHGGTVTATGGGSGSTDGGAGIGGGYKGAGGTITIRGGSVMAKSTTRSAGIGGGNGGAGGTIKIYGGVVTATGGERGAGIGGGNGGAGGAFYNYGGTVWATAGRADSSYESDIGKGASGSSGSFVIMGGNTIATNGKIDATAKNSDGTRVYRVAVTTPSANTDYTFSGLGSYGQTTLRSNSSKLLHLWLPNGTYAFEDDDYGYSATVASAMTTATRTAKVTVTFNDSDGTTIVAVKGLPGASLSAPPNPVKKGFTFTGWSQSVPETFPGESVVLTAQWEKVRKGVVIAFF